MKDPDNLLRKVAAPVAATIIAMLIVVAGWVFVVPRIPDVIPGIGSTTQDIESESAKAEESKKAERPSTRTPWGDPALEAKMRKITGNTSEDFVAEDAFDLTELDLTADYFAAEDEKIRDIISSDEELREVFDIITSMPGIGAQNATCLMVYTDNFTKFDMNSRKIACYYGIAPLKPMSTSAATIST